MDRRYVDPDIRDDDLRSGRRAFSVPRAVMTIDAPASAAFSVKWKITSGPPMCVP
jgi:hypothetical protein